MSHRVSLTPHYWPAAQGEPSAHEASGVKKQSFDLQRCSPLSCTSKWKTASDYMPVQALRNWRAADQTIQLRHGTLIEHLRAQIKSCLPAKVL